ncbi:MAG: response regulator transcription factor [Verrucomicrobiae bacterium]|nr:response regulator transcription factor [Verrucomicrobiae bacterium]
MSDPVTVAIVEDNQPFRDYLAALLAGAPGFQCVAACANAESAGKEIPAARPDLILVDLVLPRGSGLGLIHHFREQVPDAGVVVLTSHGDDFHLFQALQSGAVSYLIKDQTSAAHLLESLREVLAGGSPMSATIARRIASFFRDLPGELRLLAQLSQEQRQLLDRIASGHLEKQTAAELKITERALRYRLRRIYEILQVASKAEALRVHHLGRSIGL